MNNSKWRTLKICSTEYPSISVIIKRNIVEEEDDKENYNNCKLYIRNIEYDGLDDFLYNENIHHKNDNIEMCRELVHSIKDSWDDLYEYFYYDVGEIDLL